MRVGRPSRSVARGGRALAARTIRKNACGGSTTAPWNLLCGNDGSAPRERHRAASPRGHRSADADRATTARLTGTGERASALKGNEAQLQQTLSLVEDL